MSAFFDQRNIIERKVGLKISKFIKLSEDRICADTTLAFNHDSDDIFTTFVSDISDSLNLFDTHEICDFLYKFGFIDLIWKLIDDDQRSLFGLFDMYGTTTQDRSFAFGIDLTYHR